MSRYLYKFDELFEKQKAAIALECVNAEEEQAVEEELAAIEKWCELFFMAGRHSASLDRTEPCPLCEARGALKDLFDGTVMRCHHCDGCGKVLKKEER